MPFNLHLAPRLRMNGVIPPFLHMPSCMCRDRFYFLLVQESEVMFRSSIKFVER